MTLLVQYTLIYAAVLTLVALGGMFSERSGVINIGLEGIMVFGAMGGAMTMVLLPATTPPGLIVILTLIVAALVGMVSSLLLAVACINFKADQTLAGTALNMLATATATVLIKAFNTKRSNGSNFSAILDYIDARRGFIFKIGKLELSWFIVIAIILLIVSWVVLYKTKFGLRLRSCGEHPRRRQRRYQRLQNEIRGVIISGALGGLGGLIYIAAANSTWHFDVGVAGAGFLALAVMIFGQWKPIRIALAALLFGLFRALSNVYLGIDWLANIGISGTVYNMLPYIVSLIVLAFTSKSRARRKRRGFRTTRVCAKLWQNYISNSGRWAARKQPRPLLPNSTMKSAA